MPTIVQLSSDLINKIAAGEVVERPASVVKELVENALDAGATKVEVELDGGGRDRILVADDGKGMSREDALLAIERHATSKLRDVEGLFSIESFGFRGEAVPAIASVSRMTLTTREPDALEGTRIEIEGGRVGAAESVGAPRGTTFEIRDLFFATPARRKFLKRPETEASHASEALVRLALARPDVSFSLRSSGRLVFQSPAIRDGRERIAAAIGKEIFEHLLEVDHALGTIRVRGFAASPGFSAPTARAIYTYVNGRFIRDRQLMHAIQRAYEGLLPAGRSPGLVVFIEVPPHEVDVNVHPQKLEVRFADPRGVYDALYRGISEALSTGDWLRREAKGPGGLPASKRYSVPASGQPAFDWQARYRQLGVQPGAGRGAPPPIGGPAIREAAAALWPRDGDREAASGTGSSAVPPSAGLDPAGTFAGHPDLDPAGEIPSVEAGQFGSLRYIGQLGSTYLLCEAPAGDLLILSLHAIRERLTLQQLGADVRDGNAAGPPFLFPLIVDPGLANAKVLLHEHALLERIGFDLEPFGGTNFALKSVPSPVVGADYEDLLGGLAGILESAAAGQGEAHALAFLACVAAGFAEQNLTTEEALHLLEELDGADLELDCIHRRILVASVPIGALDQRR